MKVQGQDIQSNTTQSELQLMLAEMVAATIVQQLLDETTEASQESNQ